MYAVAGATGNTGRIAVEDLLERGAKVRALVRNAQKAHDLGDRGAEIVVVDLDDEAALTRALTGVEGAYLLNPPSFSSTDFVNETQARARRFAKAAEAAKVPHVVWLSSIGGQHDTGTGIIRSVHRGEEVLSKASVPATFLRPAYFIDNWGMVIGAAKGDGVVPSFFGPADRAIPMLSTRDIGRTAASLLLGGPGSGGPGSGGPRSDRSVVELAGPRDYSPNDVAAALGARLGRKLEVVLVPEAQRAPTLMQFGASQHVADLFAEMYRGIESGRVAFESEQPSQRGRVTLDEALGALLGE